MRWCPQVRELERESGDLTSKLGAAYGEADVFVALVDKCFEAKVREGAEAVLCCAALAALEQAAGHPGLVCTFRDCLCLALGGAGRRPTHHTLHPLHTTPTGGQVFVRGLPLWQGVPEGGPLLHLAGHLGGPAGRRHVSACPRSLARLLAGWPIRLLASLYACFRLAAALLAARLAGWLAERWRCAAVQGVPGARSAAPASLLLLPCWV